MTLRRQYANAPIAEAIIDLRVEATTEFDLGLLEQVSNEARDSYPDVSPIFAASGAFQFSANGETQGSARRVQVGYRGKSADGTQICQWQLTGFTFSRLPPYERWEPFRDEARTKWDSFRQTIKPRKVSRVAVRYINRIEIPEPVVDLKRYFRTSPEISPELPQEMSGFFMQVRIPQSDMDAIAVINQTLTNELDQGGVSVILDIDLFRMISDEISEPVLWEFFETLHARKNRIFEACITNETRSLFD
jgi:uncharacterized protein (TIGR04255 family)